MEHYINIVEKVAEYMERRLYDSGGRKKCAHHKHRIRKVGQASAKSVPLLIVGLGFFLAVSLAQTHDSSDKIEFIKDFVILYFDGKTLQNFNDFYGLWAQKRFT